MARLNIEDRFFGEGRLRKLARLLKMEVPSAAGILIFIWHESQSQLRTSGSKNELVDWSWSTKIDGQKLISALLEAGYISKVNDSDQFVIHGNEIQVTNLVNYNKRAQAGGEANKKKWEKLKEASSIASSYPQDSVKLSSSKLTDSDKHSLNELEDSSIQFNSIQDKTRQDKTKEENTTIPLNGQASPIEKKRPSPKKLVFDQCDLTIARDWLEFAKREMPWKASEPSWAVERFANDIAEVKRKTGINDNGMTELLAFIRGDDFWRTVAVSPGGLLKKSAKNGNRKIDNILARMKTPGERNLEALQQWASGDDDVSAIPEFLRLRKKG